jgi:hypothetical protein
MKRTLKCALWAGAAISSILLVSRSNEASAGQKSNGESEWVGWITFRGEFSLFKLKDDVGKYPKRCVNVAFPNNYVMKKAQGAVGRKVVIYGRSVSWPAPSQLVNSLRYGASYVFNNCDVDTFIVADKIKFP